VNRLDGGFGVFDAHLDALLVVHRVVAFVVGEHRASERMEKREKRKATRGKNTEKSVMG
jgi:hypothetical protein